MKILYVSHGHPQLNCGGGEWAAWRLFEHFGPESCGFLAAAPASGALPPGCEVKELAPRQWLIKPSTSAVMHDTAVNLNRNGQLHAALAQHNFALIHLHHYLHVGLDLVFALRRWFPQAPLVLTLHDYWGPCAYEGRLLRRDGQLCDGPRPAACDQCLGGNQRTELAIRQARLQQLKGCIDHWIAPSYFLKRQYLKWGVDPRRLSVIDNLPPTFAAAAPPSASAATDEPGIDVFVVAYCGQINRWKGIDLIVEGFLLAQQHHPEMQLQIHGGWPAAGTGDALIEALRQKLKSLPAQLVQCCGTYQPGELPQRLQAVDVVVMGSRWYENAPMIINEAHRYGRPVLAPDLGGMAEKIKHDITGWLFKPGDINSLAKALIKAAKNGKCLRTNNTAKSISLNAINKQAKCHKQHKAFYDKLLSLTQYHDIRFSQLARDS